MHSSHQEKMEMAAALKERYLAKEIDTKQLIAELRKLRLSIDEVGEIAKDAINARNGSSGCGGDRSLVGAGFVGGYDTSPQARANYEASVEWLADYRRRKLGRK